ncbi:hypothetical protein [Sphingomonas lenta]|uniref:hypothetical protein n=1 Tax=Sphingomonas lenta TaxID=1141887 RepID=UPI001140C701|nr:hypothetical protein [Sphingomonas lenta]
MQVFTAFERETWSGKIFANQVAARTDASGTDTFDYLFTWNKVKNVQLLSDTAQSVVLDGFVHVDAQIGVDDVAATSLMLVGAKRANVITGLGDDKVDIQMVSDVNSSWVDDFRVATGAGDDLVKLSGLDVQAQLAAGDRTYLEAVNKPGLLLTNSGVGGNAYVDLGAGDDRLFGYESNEWVIAGTDDGAVEQVLATAPPKGFGYAVGGSTAKGGCASVLYKIDLATGAATAVGEVKLQIGWLPITGLEIESLSLNPKDGQLYGFASKFGILDALVKIDPLTAKTTYIKLNCNNLHAELQDMAFDAAGNLYLAVNGDFLQVDTKTGAIKTLGNDTLDCKIGALAIDASGRVFGLAELGVKGTIVYEIDRATGKTIAAHKIAGLDKNSAIEGMSFDSAGTLWAVDRVTGATYKIDLAAKKAVLAATTLSDKQQFGDGFEALAIDGAVVKTLVDLNALGGDVVTTGLGSDRLYYAAGDGVDTITDFDVANDTLHIAGYAADRVRIDVFNGDTFIRFTDSSPDGFVDDAMIQLSGVANFALSMLKFEDTPW